MFVISNINPTRPGLLATRMKQGPRDLLESRDLKYLQELLDDEPIATTVKKEKSIVLSTPVNNRTHLTATNMGRKNLRKCEICGSTVADKIF